MTRHGRARARDSPCSRKPGPRVPLLELVDVRGGPIMAQGRGAPLDLRLMVAACILTPHAARASLGAALGLAPGPSPDPEKNTQLPAGAGPSRRGQGVQFSRMANLPTFSVSGWIVTSSGPALRARGFLAVIGGPVQTRFVARPHRAPWRWRTLGGRRLDDS